MADDHTQRPYRSNEPPVRGTPAAAPGSSSGSDPLAELARLIGQSDPFAEFGRDGARRGAAPQTAAPAQNYGANDYYDAAPAAQPPMPEAAPARARQPYANPTYPADRYHIENAVPGYPAAQAGGYEADAYQSAMHPAGAEEDVYDDVPPTRRRIGIMAIAAVFALAVIGTAGAFGYRALFGSSGPSGPPPVIKADTAPSKIVPATASKSPNKLIYDRVADRGQDEKLVSREEQPVDRPADNQQQAAATLGSGVVGAEPKKIRTIAIHPDQATIADNQPANTANAPARMTALPVRQVGPPPPRVASNPPAEANPEPQQPAPRAVSPPRQAAAPAPSNAPLSLSPDAPAAPAPAARPMRTAAAATPAAIAPPARPATPASGGGYAVQVSSQRSEAEAQAAFRSLQAKYPNQLGGKQVQIHKVELGEKGTYYRAMVGPFADANAATELCSGLKAAGGQCLVQRN